MGIDSKSLDSESRGDERLTKRKRHVPTAEEGNPQTWGEMFKAWPKTTLCIVSNECCERFSYYGMRTVLTLYLLNVLKFSDNISTVFFNGFTVLCYLTPLLGSVLADGYIGKFKTIFFVSILYAAGQIVLAIASTENSASKIHPLMDLAGLLIIGFGTGGIKPCVVSFGGDQFLPEQERMRSLFFSMFYFSINFGSMISTFISPIFRSQPCLGQDSCYPLAFGIPAILMIVATLAFMAGSPWYKKPPPKENIFAEVFKVISGKYLRGHSCQNEEKCLELQKKKRDKSVCQKREFIEDTKAMGRVLIMFLPVPIFWSLYDQQGSVWLIQGVQMDCKLWGNALLLPDQMQTLNAVLILAFIPIFQVIVYPLVGKVVKLTPLRKMVAGGVLATATFVISAFVQFSVNKTLPQLPSDNHAYVSVMNGFQDCYINVSHIGTATPMRIDANSSLENDKLNNVFRTFDIPDGDNTFTISYFANPSVSKPDCMQVNNLPKQVKYSFSGGDVHYIYVGMNGAFTSKVETDKATDGNGEFKLSIVFALDNTTYLGNIAVCRKDTEGTDDQHPCDPNRPQDFYFYEVDYDDDQDSDLDSAQVYNTLNGTTDKYASVYTFKSVRPGDWGVYYLNETAKSVGKRTLSKDQIHVSTKLVEFTNYKQGGVYVMVINGPNSSHPINKYTLFKAVQDNSVSILWQVPQYVMITAAEILFSITGYEFAYSQAPLSMKALVQAFWLLTTAIGDSIIVGIAAANIFSNMAIQFLAYAGIMLVVIAIFAVMAHFYTYRYYNESGDVPDDYDDEEELVDGTTQPYANDNRGYKKSIGETDSWDYRM